MRLITRPLPETAEEKQRGINMVDLMMWLVIAALLLAAAIQSIGYYQKASWAYQAKNDVSNVQSWAAARVSLDGKVPSIDDMTAAIASGDLKLTKNGTTSNTGMIAVQGDKYCVGVQSSTLTGSNVFYSSSDAPSNILQDTTIPAACGTASTAVPTATPTASPTATPTTPPTFNVSFTSRLNAAGTGIHTSLASSADGTKLITNTNGSYPYTSTDSGVTWTQRTTAPSGANKMASSADGSVLMAGSTGYATISKDSGATWNTIASSTGGTTDQRYSAISADGTRLAFANPSQSIWISQNGGTSWTKSTAVAPIAFQSITISDDGTHLAAMTGFKLYTSTDSGATWANQTGSTVPNWGGAPTSLVSSPDGMKLTLAVNGPSTYGFIYRSNDGGVTWTKFTAAGDRNWIGVASSPDGTRIIAQADFVDGVYFSSDSGATWALKGPSGSGSRWGGFAASSDTRKFVLGYNNGLLVTGTLS